MDKLDIFHDYNSIKLALSLQNLYRTIKNKKYILENKLRTIYELIFSIMLHIQNNNENLIISKKTYNDSMHDLDNILTFYNFTKNKNDSIKFSLSKLNIVTIFYELIKNKLLILLGDVGSISIIETINFIIDCNILDKIKKLKNMLLFYDKFFIPLSIKFNKTNNNNKIDFSIKKTNRFIGTSFIEKINGAILNINIDNFNIKIKGYFKKDPLNIIRYEGKLQIKNIEIQDELKLLDVPDDFKKKYLEQITLRDFVVLSKKEIIDLFKKSYNELLKYKKKTLSSLIKEFVKCPPEKQRNILTLFLLSDTDDQFLAQVIYDMLSNKSNLYKERPLAEQIYSSLHWSVQKIFKNVVKNVEDQRMKLQDLSENDISYEKRISLMKASDTTKKKGYDRLKEMNGGKESSAKALQYIDALLKIPFNIYQKEAILSFIDDFILLLNEKIKYIEKKINNIENKDIKILFEDFIENCNDSIINTDRDINIFIKKTVFLLNNISKILNICIKKFNINDLKVIDINSELIIVNNEEPIIDSYDDDDDKNDNLDEINSSLIDNYCFSDDSSCDSELNDSSYDSDKSDGKTNVNELIKSKNKIPNMDIIKENIQKIKKIQNIKDILIENNNINEKTLNMMKNQLELIKNNIGFSNYEDSNKKINASEDNKKNINFIIDKKYNNIDYNDLITNIYLELYVIVEKWIKYKKEKREYLNNVNNILDGCVFGHRDSKKQISRLIAQWMNGKMTGTCIGFCGPPGVGKTSICKNGLSKCLIDDNGKARPFAFLPLGGSSNGPLLEGHHYTYLGSTWGKVVDILINSKCMNPIIYIDELDKVSNTENGKEIMSILTHLTDPTQNMEFNDRYFAGIPLDLSKAIFIFSYNDSNKIDRILKDRIHEINIKALTRNEKIKITKNYLMPEILKMVGFNNGDIIIKNKAIEFIIDNYTYEAGVRKLNEHLLVLVREINLNIIMNNNEILLPFNIDVSFIKNIFSNKQIIKFKKIFPTPNTGLVNGLYATNSGLGGLTIIEVLRTPSERAYSLHLTGQQGDVMKESMHCAKTLAWNLIPESIKKKLKNEWEKNGQWGLHIHCPEGATPKDGPSAGCAITIAIISRLCNIPIKNTIAITGEINLNGNIGQVGGISSKLDGAHKAGVETVFIPKDNEQDYNNYLKKIEENLISSDEYSDNEDNKIDSNTNKHYLNVVLVSRIEELLKSVFTKNIKFKNI